MSGPKWVALGIALPILSESATIPNLGESGQRIRSLYEERGYRAEVIHSKLENDKREEVIRDLKNGTPRLHRSGRDAWRNRFRWDRLL